VIFIVDIVFEPLSTTSDAHKDFSDDKKDVVNEDDDDEES